MRSGGFDLWSNFGKNRPESGLPASLLLWNPCVVKKAFLISRLFAIKKPTDYGSYFLNVGFCRSNYVSERSTRDWCDLLESKIREGCINLWSRRIRIIFQCVLIKTGNIFGGVLTVWVVCFEYKTIIFCGFEKFEYAPLNFIELRTGEACFFYCMMYWTWNFASTNWPLDVFSLEKRKIISVRSPPSGYDFITDSKSAFSSSKFFWRGST